MHTFNGHLSSSDHPDGIVTAAGYVKVFNNILYDLYNPDDPDGFGHNLYLGLYSPEATTDGYLYYYNNVVIQPVGETNGNNAGNKGIELGGMTNINSLHNVLIANNTFIGSPGIGMSIHFGAHTDSTLSNINIANNIVYNCGRDVSDAVLLTNSSHQSLDVGSDDTNTVMFNGNVIYAGADGADRISYQDLFLTHGEFKTLTGAQDMGGNFDPELEPPLYNPANEFSPVIEAGVNLYQYFQNDHAGIQRPETGNWDIGAYQYVEELDEEPEDLNGDGLVDIQDLYLVSVNYGKNDESVDWDEVKATDVNNDCMVDITDLVIVAMKILE